MVHKRRRPIRSCIECRRRKLKCDRNYPCMRCENAGHAQGCSYDFSGARETFSITPEEETRIAQHGNSNSTENRNSKKPFNPRRTEHQSRPFQEEMLEVESYVKSAGSRPISSVKYFGLAHPAVPGVGNSGNSMHDLEQMLLIGKPFRTRYFGPSCPIAVLLQCQELSDFIQRLLRHASFSSQRRMQTLDSSEKLVGKRGRVDQLWDKEELISLMPPRTRADCLIQAYLDIFESSYRVFHVPTFLRRFEEFWRSPSETSESTIVQILLAMATVTAFVPGSVEGLVSCGSGSRREEAKNTIRAAESWLRVQSQKNVTVDMFQVHVILFHAKKMNCIERKGAWASIGALIRLGMAAGLHREPTLLSQMISAFEAEMRRRLWYTILELELQEACDRGMQPMLSADSWDCMPPRNIHDEEFDKMATDSPPERCIHEHTRTSFLCVAQSHLSLRLEVLKKTNSLKDGIDIDSAKDYVETFQDLFDGLPRWAETPSSGVARALSRLILYEQLMVLQQPFVTRAGSDRRCFYFRVIQRQTAINLMRLYLSLPRSECLPLFNIRGDGFRAVFTMCFEAVQSSGAENNELYNREAEIHLLERTVTLFVERLRNLGQGFQSYWLASAALGLMKIRYSEEPNDEVIAAEISNDAFALLQELVNTHGNDNHGLNSVDIAGVHDQMIPPTSDSMLDLDVFTDFVDMDLSPGWLLGFDIAGAGNINVSSETP